MSKAEKFIREHTKICSNIVYNYRIIEKGLVKPIHKEWVTSYEARKAVEIARKEIYEWLEENAANFVGLADDEHAPIGDTKAFYGTKSLIYYLKQAMKDE